MKLLNPFIVVLLGVPLLLMSSSLALQTTSHSPLEALMIYWDEVEKITQEKCSLHRENSGFVFKCGDVEVAPKHFNQQYREKYQ